jgi:NAD(P)-dependent dehydrogenase (short-subunit alcohol dehydrogenase family)
MSRTNAELSRTKIAIVTGGSRGLGRNTVLNLVNRGVHSIFTYNSNRAEAEKVVAAVKEVGAKATALQLDAGNVSSFDAFVKSVQTALTGLGAERFDYLVNNAGTSHHNTFEKTTEQELDSLYNVHFKGVFFLTQKFAAADERRRQNREYSIGPHAHHNSRKRFLCIHEGRHRGSHPLPGEGAGNARNRGQHCRPRRHRDRF